MKTMTTDRQEFKSKDMLKQIIYKVLVAEDNKAKKEQRDELIKYLRKNY